MIKNVIKSVAKSEALSPWCTAINDYLDYQMKAKRIVDGDIKNHPPLSQEEYDKESERLCSKINQHAGQDIESFSKDWLEIQEKAAIIASDHLCSRLIRDEEAWFVYDDTMGVFEGFLGVRLFENQDVYSIVAESMFAASVRASNMLGWDGFEFAVSDCSSIFIFAPDIEVATEVAQESFGRDLRLLSEGYGDEYVSYIEEHEEERGMTPFGLAELLWGKGTLKERTEAALLAAY